MDKLGQAPDKAKSKKGSAKPKSGKKRKSKGESCSLFLAQMVKRIGMKKKPKSAVQSSAEIVRSVLSGLTNTLPVVVSVKETPSLKKGSIIPIQTAETDGVKKIPSPVKESQITMRTENHSTVKKTRSPDKLSLRPVWNSNNNSAVKRIQSPSKVTRTSTGRSSNVNQATTLKNPHIEQLHVPKVDNEMVALLEPPVENLDPVMAIELEPEIPSQPLSELPQPEFEMLKIPEPKSPMVREPEQSLSLETKLEPIEQKMAESDTEIEVFEKKTKGKFAIPSMPLVNSDIFKKQEEIKRRQKMKITTEDVAINTIPQRDVAGEITKHVDTLRKISVIAEEFNKKTAKNLKEIIQSVELDLLKKLDEISKEENDAAATSSPMKIIPIQE